MNLSLMEEIRKKSLPQSATAANPQSYGNHDILLYQIRILLEELREIERKAGEHRQNGRYPDLERLAKTGIVAGALQHIQNFIWTVKRHWPAAAQKVTDAAEKAPWIWHQDKVAPAGPRLLVDITHTYRANSFGGISRVCRELARAATKRSDVLAVVMREGELYTFLSDARGSHTKILPQAGDIYLLADCYWHHIDETVNQLELMRMRNVDSSLLVHDLLPIQYPALFDQSLVSQFCESFRRVLPLIDTAVGVSNCVAQDLKDLFNDPGRIKAFHLGVSFDEETPLGSSALADIFCGPDPVFLSVGTLEPRKGIAIVLDAFDVLWERGVSARYLIVGRPGWRTRALQRRIERHPLLGQKLFWACAADDEDLRFAYTRAFCLVQASVAEGFGLPLIEAAHFRLPIVASDIPVFREVGGDNVTFFKACDPSDLAEKIHSSIIERPSQRSLPYLSWTESLEELVTCLRDGRRR